MEQEITILPPAMEANSSQSPAAVSATHLVMAVLLFPTSLVGVVVNSLYLWVLRQKIRRTVTTLWFLNLVLCYLLFTLLIPFFAVYILLGYRWVFGTAMCKLFNTCISVGMFSCVFLLTLISLDRYALTCHPVWSRHHRTMSRARNLVVGMWLVSFALSTPYLAFRETRVEEGGRIICINNYALSKAWTRAEMLDRERQIHVAIFVVRFLLGFLLPFCTIAGCYGQMGLKMKEKRLAWGRKPFKVMAAAVASFFLSWLPYHLYHGLKLCKDVSELVTSAMFVIYIVTSFFNACFTPVLYLFVGEKFKQVFRTSLLTLVKAAFVDELESSAHESSGRHGSEIQNI
nr:probable G-protein coupled receptor 33 [Pelodiscus sinensis]|eukprot:XP_025039043.1 probable G-protein coupled receptor 33 [Pelodiscus sinensis]